MKARCIAEHVDFELSNRASLTNHNIDLERILFDQTLVERLDPGGGNFPSSGRFLAKLNFDRIRLYSRVKAREDLGLK